MSLKNVNQEQVKELIQDVLLNMRITEQFTTSEEEKSQGSLRFVKQLDCSIAVKKAVRDQMSADQNISFNKDKLKNRNKMRIPPVHTVTGGFSVFAGTLRRISLHFGIGIRSYFVFLKFILLLNLFSAIISIIFIFLPNTILYWNYDPYTAPVTGTQTASFNLSRSCSALYVVNVTYSSMALIQDFIQGTGWLENSGLFYGYYKGVNSDLSSLLGINVSYDLSIAYLITLCAYYLISLICISTSINSAFKTATKEKSNLIGQHIYTGFIFAGKDLVQTNKCVNETLKKILVNDIMISLTENKDKVRRHNRSICEKLILYLKRIVINVLVLGLLGGSGYLIFYVYSYALQVSVSGNYYFDNSNYKLFIQYAPSLTLVLLNIIIPITIEMVAVWEDYLSKTELRVVLVRTILIKLASFSILIYTLFTQITCQPKDSCYTSTGSCTAIRCWETYVAQQLYKLMIMDFIVSSFMTLVVEPFRRFCCGNLLNPPEFSILKNVLDLIYNQTIAWIGACFSPLFSTICTIKYLITFYLKLMSIYYFSVPQNKSYLSSNVMGLFLGFLLMMYIILAVPITYIIFTQPPSKGCGPFREYTTMFESLSTSLKSLNHNFFNFLNFSISTSVTLLIILILLLLLTYYVNMASSLRIVIRKVKEALMMETQSKRMLMAKM